MVEYLDKKVNSKNQQKPNSVQALAQSPSGQNRGGDGPSKANNHDDAISVVSAPISNLFVYNSHL